MAHLWYTSLGNLGFYDVNGNDSQPGYGLQNTGTFVNLQAEDYWSGTEYPPVSTSAWDFDFDYGRQSDVGKIGDPNVYALAVRNGDVGTILTVGDIINFINDHEDIVGIGPGNSANNKYDAFMNMLLTVADLIEAGDSKGGCGLLNSIMDKCDGLPSPPDFIDGNAETMGNLMGMLDDLTVSLGCE